jgi:BMFP domain-containing protein YqiC
MKYYKARVEALLKRIEELETKLKEKNGENIK